MSLNNLGFVSNSSAGTGVGAKFDRFLRKIQLTEAQTADAISKHERIREALNEHYYGKSLISNTSQLIGSYGKRTAIRPPRDVDLLFVLPESVRSKYTIFDSNIQSRILQEVKTVLQRRFPLTKMSADGPVIYIPFTESSFTVELVPAFRIYSGRFEVCYTKDGGSWGTTYPDEEANQLTASNQKTNGNTIRLIKMMKKWQYYCNVELDSFAIELLCQEFLQTYQYADKSSVYYDWMVRDFLKHILNKFFNSVSKPGFLLSELDIGDEWKSKARSALQRVEKAISLEEKYPYLATEEWQKVFGSDFTG